MRNYLRVLTGIAAGGVLVSVMCLAPFSQGQDLSSSATKVEEDDAGLASGDFDFLRAQQVVVLSAQVDGIIDSIPVRPQDFVAAGEVLIALDANLTMLDRMSVETKLAMNAKATAIQRVRHRYAKETLEITQAKYEEILDGFRVAGEKEMKETKEMEEIAGLEVDSSELEKGLLETQRNQYDELLSRHKVKAPVGGVLAQLTSVKALEGRNLKQPEVGEMVRAGQEVAVLMKVDRLRVLQQLPVGQLDAVKLGQAVRVHVKGASGEGIPGEIVFISPTVTSFGTFEVDVEFANPPVDGATSKRSLYRYRYRPGMEAWVEFRSAK